MNRLRVAAAAMLLAVVSPAFAQEQMVRVVATADGQGGGATPRVSRRSMEAYSALLAFTADQKSMAMSLHEGYNAASASAQREYTDAQQEATRLWRETQDESVWSEQMPEIRRAHREKSRSLERAFFEDLKALLAPDQEARWPSVERHRRRETLLRSGSVSGEGLDLIAIVDGLKLAAEAHAPMVPGLGEYELDIDRALAAKAKEQEEAPAFESGRPINPDAMRERMAKAREIGRRIKDINERYARLFEGQLPEEKRAEFTQAVREASFPRVYRPSLASRALDAAAGFGDLDAGQREAVEALRAAYRRDLGVVNDRWAAAIEDAERTGAGGSMAVAGMGHVEISFGQDEASPVADARKARRELDQRTREKLDSILSADQKERLPREAGPHEGAVQVGEDQVFIRRGN